jgi:hypothetical protein
MSVDQMSVNQMYVDQMSVDQMSCFGSNAFRQKAWPIALNAAIGAGVKANWREPKQGILKGEVSLYY